MQTRKIAGIVLLVVGIALAANELVYPRGQPIHSSALIVCFCAAAVLLRIGRRKYR
jgi:hypothetical protein